MYPIMQLPRRPGFDYSWPFPNQFLQPPYSIMCFQIEEATRAHVAATSQYESLKTEYDQIRRKFHAARVKLREAEERLRDARDMVS
jgi:hypothetical protein